MNDALDQQEPSPARAPRGRRYRRHELQLADGGKLVLGVDGTIAHLDAEGSTTRSWVPDDPEWAGHALRFGLRPPAPTVAPQGRGVQATKPPRG